jgi:uncharacterized protein YndB with AHSA1/START domain
MSKTKQVSVKIALRAPAEQVFAAVTSWELQKKWIFATHVRGVGNESHKLGGKLEAFTGFGKLGFLDTMTITKWDPPHVCEVTHTGNFVKGKGLFEVSSENNTTYFIWTEYLDLPFGIIGQIGWPLVWLSSKIGLYASLRRFKKLVEKQ